MDLKKLNLPEKEQKILEAAIDVFSGKKGLAGQQQVKLPSVPV